MAGRCAFTQKSLQIEGNCLRIQDENCALVPDPSERTTGMIGVAGSASFGLSAAIAGSFHFVITPVNIFGLPGDQVVEIGRLVSI